jgi:hypothetical protein
VCDIEDIRFCDSYFVKCSHGLFKSSINPITNPNPVYCHTLTRDNIFGAIYMHDYKYSLVGL